VLKTNKIQEKCSIIEHLKTIVCKVSSKDADGLCISRKTTSIEVISRE